MDSARHLYRLGVALALGGAAAVIVGMGVALSNVSLTPPPVAELAAACRRLVPPDAGFGAVLVLLLAGLGTVVVAFAGRSLATQLLGQRRLWRDLRTLETAELAGVPVRLIDDRRPRAFCAGLLRPRIYVSKAARDSLPEAELRAVLAHEEHHRLQRDPLRILLARMLGEALFFLPVLRHLARRYEALAELAADEAALRVTGAQPLAAALIGFHGQAPRGAVGIAPERVDHLLGQAPRWELPLPLLGLSLLAAGSLVGASLVGVAAIGGAHLNLAMVIAHSCMLLMVLAPLALAARWLFRSRTFCWRRIY